MDDLSSGTDTFLFTDVVLEVDRDQGAGTEPRVGR